MKKKVNRSTFSKETLLLVAVVLFIFGMSASKTNALTQVLTDDQAVKASLVVKAFVPSRASEVNSALTLVGGPEFPADNNTSAVVVATLIVKEGEADAGAPLPNTPIKITSNRGDADIIEPADAMTNADGKATFTIKTAVPGRSTISGIADNYLVISNKVTITWAPLPIPVDTIISISLPKVVQQIVGEDKIVIFDSTTPNEGAMVYSGREIIIPYWGVLFFVLFSAISWIMLVYLIHLTRKIRKYEERDLQMLEKEDKILENEEKLLEIIDQNNKDDASKEITSRR